MSSAPHGRSVYAPTSNGRSSITGIIDSVGDAEKVDEHAGGGAPHRLVGEFEKVDGTLERRHPPALFVKHPVGHQLLEADKEDPFDLEGARAEFGGPLGQDTNEPMDERAASDGGDVVERADDLDVARIEGDLLGRLAESRIENRLTRVETPAGEAHLT